MSCTLYRFYDAEDRLLYVGITAAAATRIAQHTAKEWFPKVARADFEHYPSRAEAMAAEKAAIKADQPLYNIRHAEAPGEFNAQDAADYIRVSVSTVYHWAASGRIPCRRRQDGAYRFRKVELDAWLRSLRNREAVA